MTHPAATLRPVTWAVALLATPLAVALLRGLPTAAGGDPRWLTPVVAALLAIGAAAATGRALVDAMRTSRLRDGLQAAAAAMLAAGAAVGVLGGAMPPTLPVALGLTAGSATWVAGAVANDGARVPPAAAAIGTVLGAVLVGAVALFIAWPEGTALALGVLGGALLLMASLAAWRRGASAAVPLALLAGGSVALSLSRPEGAEAVVALVALVAACVLLTAESTLEREAASIVPAGTGLPRLARALAEGVLLLDREGRIVDWNVAAATMLELGADPRGQRADEVLAPLVGDAAWISLTTPASDGERRTVTERGRPMELTVADDDDGATVVLVRDLSLERGEATEAARLTRELRGTIEELLDARRTISLQRSEIERASLVDALTGAASRRAILERLHGEVAQARRYSHPVVLVLVDVDDLAAVNRDHGLGVGDAVLRELALRLRLRMREADALGRLAGDAFAAVLPHTDERGAAVFAEAILRRMTRRPIETAAGPLTVTVSVGVALMHPGMELDDEGLLAAADEALASARRGGGNRIAFDRRHGLVRLEERRRPPAPGPAPTASSEDEEPA